VAFSVHTSFSSPADILDTDGTTGCRQGIPPNLKGLAMTPKFLREEAARFRGMAETVDREASKERFLAMAIDFEARANAADAPPDTDADAAASGRAARKIAREAKDAV
jgi:hypothetical protein